MPILSLQAYSPAEIKEAVEKVGSEVDDSLGLSLREGENGQYGGVPNGRFHLHGVGTPVGLSSRAQRGICTDTCGSLAMLGMTTMMVGYSCGKLLRNSAR